MLIIGLALKNPHKNYSGISTWAWNIFQTVMHLAGLALRRKIYYDYITMKKNFFHFSIFDDSSVQSVVLSGSRNARSKFLYIQISKCWHRNQDPGILPSRELNPNYYVCITLTCFAVLV